jgi:hypothetical protein
MSEAIKELNKLLTRRVPYEQTADGLFFPGEGLLAVGEWEVYVNGLLDETAPNLVVTQGRNYLLGVGFKGDAALSTWYVALFSGDVTPQATWTAANFHSQATEFVNYSEASRPVWTEGDVASGVVDNYASRASFTINEDSQTVRGAALLSTSTKQGTTGTLYAAVRFVNAKTLDSDETLDVGYRVSLVTPS